ncbi:MAG: ATP-binding protein [Chloroflexota bacterium]
MKMSRAHKNADQKDLAASRILAVTEEELQQIVLDVHDGPVQLLFAALSQIQLIQKQRANGESFPEADWDASIARLSGLLEESLREIREFLGTFRSPDFPKREITDIIQGLLMQHEAYQECQIEFTPSENPLPVSLPAKIALYRICQEALSNAYRHAGVDRVSVTLEKSDEMVALEVRDWGRGFDPPLLVGREATEREEHIGLRGMRDRVGLVGGQFELRSAPGKGTHIIARVPADE